MQKGRREDLRETWLLAIGAGVFVVWSITHLASVFFGRPLDPAVDGILGLIVTGILGGGYLSGRRNGKDEKENDAGIDS